MSTEDFMDADIHEPQGKCWCAHCENDSLRALSPIDKLFARRFIVCPDCGNKRCPKATCHTRNCTGSNDPGQHGSRYGVDGPCATHGAACHSTTAISEPVIEEAPDFEFEPFERKPGELLWRVEVSHNGEPFLALEDSCIAGGEITPERQECIYRAAEHLMAFAGPFKAAPMVQISLEDAKIIAASFALVHRNRREIVERISNAIAAAEGKP